MADSSFDVVNKVDRQEVDNALRTAAKELAQRFDFRGTGAEISWSGEESINAQAETEERLQAAIDVFRERLVKRGLSLKAIDFSEPKQSGKLYKFSGTAAPRNRLGQREENRQENPRRGPQGRASSDPGRPVTSF